MKFENYFHPVSSHLLLFFNLIPRSHLIYILAVIIMIILEITRGATVTGCAPVISFCCKGLFISMKTKSNAVAK